MRRITRLSVVGILLLGSWSSTAWAACSDDGYETQLTGTDITGALNNKRVLTASGEWKEDHCDNGNLYKVGDGSTIDPRAFRGTWGVAGDQVTYHYTVGGNLMYSFELWEDTDGTGGLCWEDGAGTIVATTPSAPGGFTEGCGTPPPP